MKSVITLLSIFLIVGCTTKKTDKELFDETQKYLKQNNIPEAVIAFEEIINDYPDSHLAPEALSQLAGLYQNKLIKSITEKENLKKAVELFIKLHNDYPKSSFAPSGLFMAAFINANELQNYDEATRLYKQFLQEYPDDELAASAKAELDNMGLTPEQILMKNLAKEK